MNDSFGSNSHLMNIEIVRLDKVIQLSCCLIFMSIVYTIIILSPIQETYYAFIPYIIRITSTIGAAFVFLITASKECGHKKWAWGLQAASAFSGITVFAVQNFLYFNQQTVLAATLTPLYLIVYICAILGTAIYFPKTAWQLGNAPRVILESFAIGCAFFVLANHILPESIQHTVDWLGWDIGLLFGVSVVYVRVRQYGGPLAFLAWMSVIGVFIAHCIYVFSSIFGNSSWVAIAGSFELLQPILLSLGAYLSVRYPPHIPNSEFVIFHTTETLLWNDIPRILFFIVSIIILLSTDNITIAFILLFSIGFAREIFASLDHRRVLQWLRITHEALDLTNRDLVAATDDLALVNRQLEETNHQLRTAQIHTEQINRKLTATNQALETANQQLRAYMVQAEDLAVEQERVRVAREIHDGLGHHLNNVKVHVGVAYRAFEADPPVALDSLSIAKTEIRNAQRELRHAIDALVSNDHLAGSLEDLLSEPIRDCQLAGISVDFAVVGTSRSPSEQIKHVLYRIGQETLNNIRQHARAKRVTFQVHYQEQQIQIVVEDDGVGLPGSVERRRGHGLDNLQERAALVGGKTTIETRPGQGVRVVVEVPYGPHKGLDRR